MKQNALNNGGNENNQGVHVLPLHYSVEDEKPTLPPSCMRCLSRLKSRRLSLQSPLRPQNPETPVRALQAAPDLSPGQTHENRGTQGKHGLLKQRKAQNDVFI